MAILTQSLPLSLYVHIPWCVRKCPYCDFNSHVASQVLPEERYTAAVLQDLDNYSAFIRDRRLVSIFLGGGTPSLFSGQAIAAILKGIQQRVEMTHSEITLEANPGAIEEGRFHAFREAGVNRLSIGIQSLQNDKLVALGRIHQRDHAISAMAMARQAGFTNFNVDLMYGLPNQSIDEALCDMEMALAFRPTHLSWYQLTIESNTLFYHHPPVLPHDDDIWEMQIRGQAKLKMAGFQQYEISAYAQPHFICLHNRNYWEFGDYIGIGAGAHSKITDNQTGVIRRFAQVKHPRDYLRSDKRLAPAWQVISADESIFEFMLNALRLTNGIPTALFRERTGIPLRHIEPLLLQAKRAGLLHYDPTYLCPTERGKRFLNNLVMMFLPSPTRKLVSRSEGAFT
jgi:putative oxygen-independent coproporphyrinogen III oxidase